MWAEGTEVCKWPPKTGRQKSPISENGPSFGWLDGRLAKSLPTNETQGSDPGLQQK